MLTSRSTLTCFRGKYKSQFTGGRKSCRSFRVISYYVRLACFKWNNGTGKFDRTNTWWKECKEATIDEESGVQTGGPHVNSDWVGNSSYSFTFYLPYEMSFVMNFTVDNENHPRGCNIPDVYPECEWGTDPNCEYNKLPIKCGRTNFKLPGESQSSADIVEEFGGNQQVWAKEFLEGWQVR